MLHHHLPLWLSRLPTIGRHTTHLYHYAARLIELGYCRLQASPRLIGLRQIKRGTSRKLRQVRAATLLRRNVPLLIHYHIFKNAGTSFEWTLQRELGGRFRVLDSTSPRGFVSGRDITQCVRSNPALRAISSHQATLPAPSIPGRDVLTSILVRDPIARIRSIYAFERVQQSSSPGAIKAKELDFKGYVEWRLETSEGVFSNFQVHFCSKSRMNALAADERDLEIAIANLDRVDIIGTVERYEEWLALAQSVLASPFPSISLTASRQNASSAQINISKADILHDLVADLGEPLAHELLQRNQLDMCLYQVADALLSRKLAEQRVYVSLQHAYESAKQKRAIPGDRGRSAPARDI
jgi:hypothetical protein